MLATIEKVDGGYIAQFNRPLKHSVEKVWAALTENDKLEKWMSHLQVEELRQDGRIKFNMNDGTGSSFDMKILDFKEQSVLQYEWNDGWVRFELYPNEEGCLLVLKEFIKTVSDHTSIDLAGWHVCLDMFSALLEGREMDFPKDDWEHWHEEYIKVVQMV